LLHLTKCGENIFLAFTFFLKNGTPPIIMKRNFIRLFSAILLVFSMASCKGSGSATTADSTKLYSGPVSKFDSNPMKDKRKTDSLNIGPDSFKTDSARKAARH